MELTKFGKFLVRMFDNEEFMTNSDELKLSIELKMKTGLTLKELDNMSIKDIEKFKKNK